MVSAHPVVWPAACSPASRLMNSRLALDSAILIAATALTRFAFRSRFLYDIDSVNFALALRRFDPAVHQPHPPGYFLYVRLGMLSNAVFHDANTALVAISILASCGTVAMIHLLASAWFRAARGRRLCRSHLCLFTAGLVSWHGRADLYRRSVLFGPHRLFLLARLWRRKPLRIPCRGRTGIGRRVPAIFAAGPGSVVLVFDPPRSPQTRAGGNGRAGPGSHGLVHPHALCHRRHERLCFESLVAVAAGPGAANRLHFLGIHVAGPRCV